MYQQEAKLCRFDKFSHCIWAAYCDTILSEYSKLCQQRWLHQTFASCNSCENNVFVLRKSLLYSRDFSLIVKISEFEVYKSSANDNLQFMETSFKQEDSSSFPSSPIRTSFSSSSAPKPPVFVVVDVKNHSPQSNSEEDGKWTCCCCLCFRLVSQIKFFGLLSFFFLAFLFLI